MCLWGWVTWWMHAKFHCICFMTIFHVIFGVLTEPTPPHSDLIQEIKKHVYDSAVRYLLQCTCSTRAVGRVWWSCRTRWHPEVSGTPQTWHCWTLLACSSRWTPPGLRCKQSSPWWGRQLQQKYPEGTEVNINVNKWIWEEAIIIINV